MSKPTITLLAILLKPLNPFCINAVVIFSGMSDKSGNYMGKQWLWEVWPKNVLKRLFC